MIPVALEGTTRLEPADVDAIAMLVERATEADGVRPLDEHATLHIRHGGDLGATHVLAWATGTDTLAGYAHLDTSDEVEGSVGEIVVSPDHRRQGIGRLLLDRVLTLTPDGRLRLWAHGESEAATRLATGMGFTRSRILWQMRRSLSASLPRARVPEGVHLRAFRVGQDEDEWVSLNARAFRGHPEQGRWTRVDLDRRMREPWFDPEGFIVAECDGRMLGFHWTKVHGNDGHGHARIGEVYVVGVDPGLQGGGLGRALTLAGLEHLRARGLNEAMLYVDATNTAAIRVYESLGFMRWDSDVMFMR